jgi:hypothetical protein
MSDSPLTTRQQEQQQIVAVAMDLARDGRTADLAQFLDHGFPVDLRDPAGNTLLMLAAYHGHLDTVSTLVARGADVDRRNGRDQSPVAGAMFKGEDEVVRVLVAAGADLDSGSPTARETARLFGQQHLIDGQE